MLGWSPRALRLRSHEALAAAVFAAGEVGSLVWLLVLGRGQWFATDEWDFVASRTAFDLHDLVRPHNEHLSTLRR